MLLLAISTVTGLTALGFALPLGIMAILLLTVVRGDLLANWQARLPPDARILRHSGVASRRIRLRISQ